MLEKVSIIIPLAPKESEHQKLRQDLQHLNSEIIIVSEGTRAKSLNAGARKATRKFLWFLHADGRISSKNLTCLQQTLAHSPDQTLHYFDLKYQNGLVVLNAWGANIRSRILALPYGDQGFCIAKTVFDRIGGYPENTPYGEDLLFVRQAKKARIKLNRIPSAICSSARQYQQQGWLKLTLQRQWQMIKLMRQKL